MNGFNKLFWGFLFILINIRIGGIDILPDVIGYILFAIGFSELETKSDNFVKAKGLNFAMIILSIFSIYEPPARYGGVNFGPLGPLGLLIGLAAIIIGLIVVYYLFKGARDMAFAAQQMDLYEEADKRWNQYWILQVVAFLMIFFIFIPSLGLLFAIGVLIAAIVIMVGILGFLKKCEERL